MIRRFALLAVLAGCTPPADRPSADSGGLSARLDSAMTDALDKRGIPGGALVLVRDTQVVYSKGTGLASIEGSVPVTDSTPFVIGSTSKSLTALGVLRSVQLGQVALDTPIARYTPELRWRDPRGAAITLRQLLTNRSGLIEGHSGPSYERPAITDDSALARMAREIAGTRLLFAPGDGYAYSNRGWALAGYVIQRASGRPVEDFMRDEVFAPLGMTQSTLAFWTVPNIAQGYVEGLSVRNHPQEASLHRGYGPAGMFVSTPRDVGRLLVALLNRGRTHGGGQFLTSELIAEALRPQAEAVSELGGPTRYSLGWEVDSMLGTTTIRKAGSVHTLVSLWVILPEKRLAMAFNFNREDYHILPLMGNVLTIAEGGRAEPFAAWSAPEEVTMPAAVELTAAQRSRWLGRYDTRFGDAVVTASGDTLFISRDGGLARLVPTSDSTAAPVSDLVSDVGKRFTLRRNRTLWSGADSLGVWISP